MLETHTRIKRYSKSDTMSLMICDYHKWMGGVDVHDLLRLQRYSIQMQTWCKKYYKSIFMGLVDVAVGNA
ncbi:hypothetical protein PHMEG_00034652 [Phytophthora megakarya]|uniref:PiggyBac transposable element-derived protein domain-containing protein n=1 Tax=Phytophthora megakarya TaxID=4795 RepID=A0A225UQJ3_9STRA|nr:hypothetical protein PHMEG_00034652 [Phytophthora megakarya]